MSLEIRRINLAAGETVFNPSATTGLRSLITELGGADEHRRLMDKFYPCICHPQRERNDHYPGCPQY